jgi:tRNA-specific adenosine deaminase 1
MASQEDATPWDVPPAEISPAISPPITSGTPPETSLGSPTVLSTPTLHGRGFFSELGLVRRKPSRPDAPRTLSKSCSDKIALNQCTSLLSSLSSLLISPSNAYISSIVLPESQYSSEACTRAFSSSGRMSVLKDKTWDGGYRFHDLKVNTTSREFKYSRRQVLADGEKVVPSNISASCTRNATSTPTVETLIGGVLQGRKQYDSRGASRVCKKKMWQLALEVAALVAVPVIERSLKAATYSELKACQQLEGRKKVKDEVREKCLKPWVRNVGGEDFGLKN